MCTNDVSLIPTCLFMCLELGANQKLGKEEMIGCDVPHFQISKQSDDFVGTRIVDLVSIRATDFFPQSGNKLIWSCDYINSFLPV